jgi:tripeptide aminopeptidase
VLDPERMPELAAKVGHDIVSASGDTLLGADDKAGIAEVVDQVRQQGDAAREQEDGQLHRGTQAEHEQRETDGAQALARAPDRGVDDAVGMAPVAVQPPHYSAHSAARRTIVAAAAAMSCTQTHSRGELQDETFSAAEALVTFHGVDVHPGFATGKLVNAKRLAGRFLAALPADLAPETTADREGFVHPYVMEGGTATATVRAIVRDFEDEKLERHVELVRRTAEEVVADEPRARVEVEVRPQYPNMRKHLEPYPEIVGAAERAIRAEGIEPIKEPIRGGTDGSRLSEMGLPTPNIFAGGHEFHSPREWVSVQDMAAATAVIVRLAAEWAE